jgi:hypothetical protein
MQITMRRPLLILGGLALLTIPASAQTAASTPPPQASSAPTIKAVLDGDRSAVFSTPQDACSQNDIPDAMARAFRDYMGTIHFISASSTNYQSLGPTLDTLVHSCEAAFVSANEANPAAYNDQVWLTSFYTLNGKEIAALSHTEYHGWSHPGECTVQNPQNLFDCEYDSDTYHQSSDGGYHFNGFKAPANLVAGVPEKYQIDLGPMGYSVDSNIVEYGGWYYAIVTDWQWPRNCSGVTGPHHCVVPLGGTPMRTKNVFEPQSWRSWNGTDFSVSFVDPYVGPVSRPQDHIFTPVPWMQFVNGLNVYKSANVVVATLWDYWDNELGPPGLYFTTSTDLVHWTTPKLVVTVAQILANDPKGSWLYAYFSLIDPDAPDPSFSVIGDHPYLYYVRLDNNGQDRVLFRQRLTLTAAE